MKRFQKQPDSDLIAKSRQLKIVLLSNESRDDEIEDCKDEEEECFACTNSRLMNNI